MPFLFLKQTVKTAAKPGKQSPQVASELSNGTLKFSQEPRRQNFGNNPVRSITDRSVRSFKGNFEVLSESSAAKLRKQPGAHYRRDGSELSNGTLKFSQEPRRQSYGNNPVRITDRSVRSFKGNFEVLSGATAAKLRKQPGAHYRPVGSELS